MTDQNNPFDGPQLQDVEYARADMSRSHFNGVNLTHAKFFAVLDHARFDDTNLESAVFDDVNLSQASFKNINLFGATFSDVNLSGASFGNLNLSDTSITNANYTGMTIEGVLVSDLLACYEKHNGA